MPGSATVSLSSLEMLLIHGNLELLNQDATVKLIKIFGPNLLEPEDLADEISRWKIRWEGCEDLPPSKLEETLHCEELSMRKSCYQNIIC